MSDDICINMFKLRNKSVAINIILERIDDEKNNAMHIKDTIKLKLKMHMIFRVDYLLI